MADNKGNGSACAIPPCKHFEADDYEEDALTIVVLGASGDLAKKKTFPSLYDLCMGGFLPSHTKILGYARSKMTDEEFRERIGKGLKDSEVKDSFLKLCHYRAGGYGDADRMAEVMKEAAEWEKETGKEKANRLFYFAIPPSQFVNVGQSIKESGLSSSGWNRMIVEKPFGKDLQSSQELSKKITGLFSEDMIYRIDHYLGKEMVQNLMILRFGNRIFEPLWNSHHIKSVLITFKEDIGTEGRGGYFDEYGIIRDVMQNHLLQVLSIIAMEPPVHVAGPDYANYVRDEKVKVLRCIEPVKLEECVLGQFVASSKGEKNGYKDDDTVPKDSKTATFATLVMHINNSRWEGVPFIMKAGKALNEKKAEIRIQFHEPAGMRMMFSGRELARNELVIRLQPDEAIYMKTNVKKPGVETKAVSSELDLSYKQRYSQDEIPAAYTRLILESLRGKQATFVRSDELAAAWSIFTPLLHRIEDEGVDPIQYRCGTRGPEESDQLIRKAGYVYHGGQYSWEVGTPPSTPTSAL